jgi:hypothetical protein
MDQILRVERVNKVTLPSSSIRLEGLGFPIIIDGVNPIGVSSPVRDDLVVQFELGINSFLLFVWLFFLLMPYWL